MITIFGIDPALNNVGYGVLRYDENNNTISDISYGIFDIRTKASTEVKLNTIFTTTQALIDKYQVDELAFEKAFHNPKRAKGGFLVRETLGAIKVAAVQKRVPIFGYTPQIVKKSIFGKGNANKEQVAVAIAEALKIKTFTFSIRFRGKLTTVSLSPTEIIKKYDHVTDGLAIAYCRLLEYQNAAKGEVIRVV